MADFSFDTGIREYPMNGTVLRVNMADNNFYHRLLGMQNTLAELEKEYIEKTRGFNGNLDIKGFPTREGESGVAAVDINALTDEQYEAVASRTEAIIEINYDIDRRVKEILRGVFGEGNDFDAIFCGVNVMALDSTGNRILSNFINAITPLIEKAQSVKAKEVDDLVGNRAARRARNRQSD